MYIMKRQLFNEQNVLLTIKKLCIVSPGNLPSCRAVYFVSLTCMVALVELCVPVLWSAGKPLLDLSVLLV